MATTTKKKKSASTNVIRLDTRKVKDEDPKERERLLAELNLLKKEAEILRAGHALPPKVEMKVSEKGAVSFYIGGRRFPISLYKSEWETVLDNAELIRDFLVDNKASLKVKE